MTRRTLVLPLLLLLALFCVAPQLVADAAPPEPRNIILFVGDGMGVSHFTVMDQLREGGSTLTAFPVTGLVTTHSSSSLVTDSAAAATAMATGVKSYNGAIAVDPDGEPLPTVLHRAQSLGMATGVVTTTNFWDATPAAFVAHAPSRRDRLEIVEQMLGSGIDLIVGAGADSFGTRGWPDLQEAAGRNGFYISRSGAELETAPAGANLAVFSKETNDLDFPDASLSFLTRKSIELLCASEEGFFLLIEHEGTDSASHSNAIGDLLSSLRSLEEAAGVALEFARRDGQTLVLLTSDHETGGFALTQGESLQNAKFTFLTRRHTGQAVPIFAFGPGSALFGGLIDNTDIGKRLFELLAR
jgi:alkaline phosphatase